MRGFLVLNRIMNMSHLRRSINKHNSVNCLAEIKIEQIYVGLGNAFKEPASINTRF